MNNKKHKIRLTVRVTSQTAYNLDRLARMSGLSVGQVVDKLTRDRMITLGGKEDGKTEDHRRN